MKKVTDPEFRKYGRVLDLKIPDLLERLGKTPLTDEVVYVASEPSLEAAAEFDAVRDSAFGGIPIQIGYCNGHNTKLNCLEYHRDSEINVPAANDAIFLLAKQQEIVDGKIDTSKVKAFRCPAGTGIEVYATTLHYAPCSAKKGQGFRVIVVLPKGTNTDKPEIQVLNTEDAWITARNKWLLAHPDADEAKQGAYVGITGENIDIADCI
jgi:ureidoglycolate hydrolase